MSPHSRAAYKIFFNQYDEDRDGKIDFKEFSDLMTSIYTTETPTRDNLIDSFQAIDTNKNNKIDFDEFLCVSIDLPPLEDLFIREFKKHDCNNDNFLSKNEVQFAVMNMKGFITGSKAQELIDKIDADKDGKVNIKEFIALLPSVYNE